MELCASNDDSIISIDERKRNNDLALYRAKQIEVHTLLIKSMATLEEGLRLAIKYGIEDELVMRMSNFVLRENA